jgi:cytochrome c553
MPGENIPAAKTGQFWVRTLAGKKGWKKPGNPMKLLVLVQEAMKDDKMTKSIKEGIKDGDTTKMKGYADALSDDEIKALVAYVRAFKK